MTKLLLFLALPVVSLTLMAASSYRTLIEDRAPAAHQADVSSVIHHPVQDIPAMSGWTLASQAELTTALEAPEFTWTGVAVSHIRTSPDRHLPDNPKQFYLAGVLIDGQHHHVQAAGPSTESIDTKNIEAHHIPFMHGHQAVN